MTQEEGEDPVTNYAFQIRSPLTASCFQRPDTGTDTSDPFVSLHFQIFLSSNEMTQMLQSEFETNWENAETWMKTIHERLKINDNTEGPRSALAARLRETEKICALEPEGKLLLDMVLMAAEHLLSKSSEEEKHDIHIKLGKLKSMFEETTVYMTHCHSRIEWVWLHWNEYLKARDEFYLWVHNTKLTLEPDVELQMGIKEKRWHYEQAQVLLRDVNNQSCLLDRLMEEAASLYNRIGDPSVDETVQREMMAEYKQIKKKAKERARYLENILKEHEAYHRDVSEFRSWLNSVIEKLKCGVGEATESTEYWLRMLQEISKEVQNGGKKLEDLEGKSLEVIKNTSPLGADDICKELEELRKALADLKHMNDDEEESLLKAHSSENAFLLLARQLEANINEFRKAIQRLEESLESGERVKSEDELVALWKTLNATKSALAAEETRGEGVKVQLKELFKFSKDVQPLSDGVIAAIREYQRAKSKAFKLSTETESALIQHFQIPLLEFQHWKRICERVLDTTSIPLSDTLLNHDCLLQIERLLEESAKIEDKLRILKTKKEQIIGVLGEQKAEAFLTEVASASRERDSLHVVLLERKKTLLSLASQSKEFDAAFDQLRKKVSTIRIKAGKESELQPDLVGKETQLQRFEMFKDDLLKLEPEFKEVASMAESSPTHKLKVSQLSSEYATLHKSLEINMRKIKAYINDHLIFNGKLLDLQHWLMVTRQELESFQDSNGHWDVESREKEIQILLSEITEKDIQLQQVESQGLLVMETSSPEGAAHIQTELRQLNASWVSLKLLWDALARAFKDRELQRLALLPPTITFENSINQRTDLLPNMELRWTTSQCDNGNNERNNSNDSEEFGPSGIVGRIVYDTSPENATLRSEKSRIPQRKSKTPNVIHENDPLFTTAEFEKSSLSLEINTSITSDSIPSKITVRTDKSRIPMRINQTSRVWHDTSPTSETVSLDSSQIPRRRAQVSSLLQVTDPLIPSADAKESSSNYIGNVEDPVSTSGESGQSSSTLNINTGFLSGSPNIPVKAPSPYNIVSVRKNKKGISLAESVDFVDSSPVQSKEQKRTESCDGYMDLLKEFELWLQEENSKLNTICSTKTSNSEEMKFRLSKLQRLQLQVPKGQRLFESLLVSVPAMAVTDNLRLEDLRYQWMLYKSKLKDAGSSSRIKTSEELRGITKKSSGGLCSFLHRVCCAALPLQLLLLFLLLLALLILLMQENQNCALSNNFARSFNLMLKYERPPPT
ncbi:nesprin-3 isoform X2 [Xenopus laevis]|uniref:Nesprin-3 n=1 Tax=Xenopus laevis TaxID=8355 RepID=A0A8J0TFP2_XENLA|nr:nesprin-3 isoform X2 [Xenopus laevis]